MSARDLRDNHKQQQYRKSSKAKNKKSKDVAHGVSLRIAAEVLTSKNASASEKKKIKTVVNSPGNLRMVSRKRNREDHENIDRSLIKKSKTSTKLIKSEETRAKQQTRVLQKQQDHIPKAAYKRGKMFYESFETKSGRKVWDSRKDHKKRK